MAVKSAAKKKPAKAAGADKPKPSLGINDLAKHMKLEPATVRKRLRDSNMKKAGKAWGWSSKTELEQTAKKLAA